MSDVDWEDWDEDSEDNESDEEAEWPIPYRITDKGRAMLAERGA